MSEPNEGPFRCEPIHVLDEATHNIVPEPRGLHHLLLERHDRNGEELEPKTLFAGPKGYIEAAAQALNNLHRGHAP